MQPRARTRAPQHRYPLAKHHVLGEKLSNQGLPVGESQEPSDRSTSERVGDVKEHGAYPTLLLVGALTVDLDPYACRSASSMAGSLSGRHHAVNDRDCAAGVPTRGDFPGDRSMPY